MAMVEWDDVYSVDIQEIDEQHKCLIEIMNELYTALANKANRDLVAEVLNKLVEYTKVHFAVEETLMRIRRVDALLSREAAAQGTIEGVERTDAPAWRHEEGS